MKRNILEYIKKDLDRKIVLLSGPRQVGKTTLAQSISEDNSYLNYDITEHRELIRHRRWPKDVNLVILDEIHKMTDWKRWLKGIYDLRKSEGRDRPQIIVTGSARLDTARKMGDSLAGRHFSYRLNPFTLKELGGSVPNTYEKLLKSGGFPEPFLENDLTFYKKWQISHLDIILRQDLLDLEQVKMIQKLEILVELLRHRVGTPCSYSSLANDLQVNYNTVKKWLSILENLFVIFRVVPYHRNIARSILKTPKYYFYDIGRVPDFPGGRFENLVALSLLSEIDFIRNTTGRKLALHYLRDKESHEIDFLITEEGKPLLAVESKWSDTSPDRSFQTFFGKNRIKVQRCVQLIGEDVEREQYDFGLHIEPAKSWLESLTL